MPERSSTAAPPKWIELIRVRSSTSALQAAMPALEAQVDALSAAAPYPETFFLQHALYEGDLAVVVVWRTPGSPKESREGLLLAEHLQRLGPVEHAVWLPMQANLHDLETKR